MKKKILGIAMVAVIAATTSWGLSQDETDLLVSDIVLNNVEALANGESLDSPISWTRVPYNDGGNLGVNCYKPGRNYCI